MTDIENIEEIIGDYNAFFSDILKRLKALNIDVTGMPISHICYRITSQAEYEEKRGQLMPFCRAIADHPYDGRQFCTMLLEKPLLLEENFSVPLIELPGLKPSYPYPSGLEHCGFIVGDTLPEFHERYNNVLTGQLDRGQYCHPSFITFDYGKSAKFYERSLQEVVELDGGKYVPVSAENTKL